MAAMLRGVSRGRARSGDRGSPPDAERALLSCGLNVQRYLRLRMSSRAEGAPAKAPLILIAVAVLAGGLIAGILLGGWQHVPRAAARASGLRADQLPGDLDGRAAPVIRLRDGR